MEERRKPGGKKQREAGWRPMDTGPGQRKTKIKQTKPPGGWAERRHGKEDRRGQGGGDGAEECGAGSGEEWVQGCRKGRRRPPTPP